jgi:hypothetical protein
MPLRVSTVVAQRWQWSGQRLPRCFNSNRFERFVYVMSVLERYSDLDCSVLLGCARREVVGARIRAFQQIEMQSTFALVAG